MGEIGLDYFSIRIFNPAPTNQPVCAGAAANTRWRWRNDGNPETPYALKVVTDEAPLIPGVFCGQ